MTTSHNLGLTFDHVQGRRGRDLLLTYLWREDTWEIPATVQLKIKVQKLGARNMTPGFHSERRVYDTATFFFDANSQTGNQSGATDHRRNLRP